MSRRSENKKNVKNYTEDSLCGYTYSNSWVLTVIETKRVVKQPEHYKCKVPDKTILSISGEDDPVTGGEKGIKETFRLLEKIGYHNFENIVYTDMEHEVLNETDYMKVYNDVLVFFEK